jgi:phosphoglycerate kinase
MFKHIKTKKNLKGKRVIVRLDLNVPLGANKKVDEDEDWRIQKSLKTINFLKKQQAKIILISHIGRDKKDTLKPVAKYFQKFIDLEFIEDILSESVYEKVDQMENGDIILLENLRQEPFEKENKSSFARGLSRLGDIYVNDAFAVCHRRHASIIGIPEHLPSYAGFQLADEIDHLKKVLKKTQRPLLFVLGGSKFETKLPLIKKFIDHADNVFLGGALINDFYKVQGFELGKSLTSGKKFNIRKLLENKSLYVPEDVLVKRGNSSVVVKPDELKKSDMIVDIGKKSEKVLKNLIDESAVVLWNGPLGFYEKGFSKGSEGGLKHLAKSKAFSIVGGGDSVVLLRDAKSEDGVNFVSTGGGAMLEFLLKGSLPGIKALD